MIKRIMILVLINCTVFSGLFRPVTVFGAENSALKYEYARILTENTLFYADPNCSIAKFYLPYGYFVKVLSVSEDSVRVLYMDDNAEIPAREGYIKTSCLHPYAGEVANPYPSVTLTLSFDEVLFADSKLSSPKTVLSSNVKAAFYGETVIGGEKYYYVYAKGYVGYVRKSAFLNAEIPAHPLPVKQNSDKNRSPDTDENSQKQTTPYASGFDSTVKTVIIIAVSLVALSVVYLLFKPSAKANYAATKKDSDDDFNF